MARRDSASATRPMWRGTRGTFLRTQGAVARRARRGGATRKARWRDAKGAVARRDSASATTRPMWRGTRGSFLRTQGAVARRERRDGATRFGERDYATDVARHAGDVPAYAR